MSLAYDHNMPESDELVPLLDQLIEYNKTRASRSPNESDYYGSYFRMLNTMDLIEKINVAHIGQRAVCDLEFTKFHDLHNFEGH